MSGTMLTVMLVLFAESATTGKTLIGLDPIFALDAEAREGTRAVGPFSALWYVVFMIPFFLWVKEPRTERRPLHIGRALASLGALLADERTGQVVRHLRQVWPDPMTGQDWGLIRQGQGIRGVYSVSALTPLRAPKGVARFDEWRFEADPPPAAPRQQTVTTAP